jgi:hypothetical protein
VPIGHVHHRQGRRGRSPHAHLSVTTTQALCPTAQGAFAISKGGERPRFIQLEHLQTFALELIKSVLTNYHQLFCKARCASPPFYLSETYMPEVVSKLPHVHSIPSSYSFYKTTFSPCSSKRSPSAPLSRLPSAARSCPPLAQAILLRARGGGRSHPHLLIRHPSSSLAGLMPVSLSQGGRTHWLTGDFVAMSSSWTASGSVTARCLGKRR